LRLVRPDTIKGASHRCNSAYQEVWDQVDALERERAQAPSDEGRMEIRYDRSVVEDFVAHLPEALRSETQSGREFLRETLKYVRVVAQESRPRVCPCAGSSSAS
jgi:hypothetical protein